MQLGQTVKGDVGHNEYWPLGQGPLKKAPQTIGIGGTAALSPCHTTRHAGPHRATP